MIEYLSNPAFYDLFGLIGFVFILSLSIWMLIKDKKPPVWSIIVLFIIGLVGFIVDWIITYVNYLK